MNDDELNRLQNIAKVDQMPIDPAAVQAAQALALSVAAAASAFYQRLRADGLNDTPATRMTTAYIGSYFQLVIALAGASPAARAE